MNAGTQVSNRPVTVAAPATPCGWWAYGEAGDKLTCGSGKPAVHVLTVTLPVAQAGTALCALHSPFDVTAEDRAILDGLVPQVTACGTFALGETVKHAELGTGTVFHIGTSGGMEVEFPGGGTIGVGDDHYGEWTQVRTDDAPALDCFQEAMAEAERDDEMISFNRTQAAARNRARETMIAEGHQRATATKVTPVHLRNGVGRTASGRIVSPALQVTTDTTKVTCKCCPRTTLFQNMYYNQARKAAQEVWAGAGITVGTVVRHQVSGCLGVVTSLGESIRVSYWGGQHSGNYARLVDFDSVCTLVKSSDLVTVGTRLVSSMGGEAVVSGVFADQVRAIRSADSVEWVWTLSEFAAELSKGYIAVVPTAKCPACREVLTNSQGHEHFGRTPDLYWR